MHFYSTLSLPFAIALSIISMLMKSLSKIDVVITNIVIKYNEKVTHCLYQLDFCEYLLNKQLMLTVDFIKQVQQELL